MRTRPGLIPYLLALAVILLVAAFPMILSLGAGAIADLNGCALNESVVNPCIVAGIDLGGTLYFFGVLGWLTFVTAPVGLLLLIAWAIAALIALFRWYRSRA